MRDEGSRPPGAPSPRPAGRRRRVLLVYNSNEHLGMTYLSAVLKAAGHEVKLAWDPQVFRGEPLVRVPFLLRRLARTRQVVDLARSWQPDVVGYGCYTDNFRWMLEVAAAIKEALPHTINLFGGVHATSAPDAVASYPQVDALVVGEAERVILDLVQGLDGGRFPTDLPGLWTRRDGELISNPPAALLDDLDSLPMRDFELFYDVIPAMERNYLCIASRGCPNSCAFCPLDMYHRRYEEIGEKTRFRRRGVEATIDELRVVKARGRAQTVSFMDEIFTLGRAWLDRFLEAYEREIGLPFWCYAYPSRLDPELLRAMRSAGCSMITMGIQSGSARVRRSVMDRRESDDQIVETATRIKEAGIRLSVDKIMGSPGETEEDLRQDLALFRRVAPDRLLCFPMTYFPGTAIIETALQTGDLNPEDVRRIEHGHLEQLPAGGRLALNSTAYRQLRLQLGLIPLAGSWEQRLAPLARALGRLPGSGVLPPLLLAANAARIGDWRFGYLVELALGARD